MSKTTDPREELEALLRALPRKKAIRAMLEKRGFNNEQIGEEAGASGEMVSKVVSGLSGGEKATAIRSTIARRLALPVDLLFPEAA